MNNNIYYVLLKMCKITKFDIKHLKTQCNKCNVVIRSKFN